MRKARDEQPDEGGRPLGMSPVVYEGVKNARREKEMLKIPHAPSGVEPQQLKVIRHHNNSITVVNRSTQRLRVSINMIDASMDTRCKMVPADGTVDSINATFKESGESHVFAPENCPYKILERGKYEYKIWSLDSRSYLYKSDSAFYD